MNVDLGRLVNHFAMGMAAADGKGYQKKNFQPGIGPHNEDEIVSFVLLELCALYPSLYRNHSL